MIDVNTKHTYTNEDGTTIELVAEPANSCVGCVGQHDGLTLCDGRVCSKLPMCTGVIWKEVV